MEHLKNKKHCLCSCQVIETQLEVWENKKCCGLHKFFPNLHACFYNSKETWKMFSFFSENALRERKKYHIFIYYYYQKVNSLCLCHHYVNSAVFLWFLACAFLQDVFSNLINCGIILPFRQISQMKA